MNYVFFFYDILHEYNIYILCCFIYCMPPLGLCWDKPRWMHGLFRCSSDETTWLVNANERHWRGCDSSVGVLVLCMYISIFTLYHIALFICRTLAIGKCSSVITCDIKKISLISLHDDVIKRSIFRVTGPLWGESTGHRWIPLTKASGAELYFFL